MTRLAESPLLFKFSSAARPAVLRCSLPFLLCFGYLFLIGCGVSGYGAAKDHSKVPVYHRVKKGETVWSLSRSYRVSPDSILLLNRLVDGDRLDVGTRLLVGYRLAGSTPRSAVAARRKEKSSETPAKLQQASLRDSPAQGTTTRKGFLRWPVEEGRVASRFGPRSGSFHDGIDIACAEGTPIYAAHGGVVVYSGSKLSGYGKLVILRQDSGLTSIYAHNSALLVSEGERVRVGQLIARSGSTGHSSGPHLHFEVRTRDRQGRYVAVDPLPLLTEGELARPRWRINESLTPILARLFN